MNKENYLDRERKYSESKSNCKVSMSVSVIIKQA